MKKKPVCFRGALTAGILKKAALFFCALLIFSTSLPAQNGQNLQEDLNSFLYQLQQEPDNPTVNYNIAQVYFFMNKMDLAIKYLERTVYLLPDDVEAMARLATIYWKIGKLASARDLLRKVVAQTPKDSESWYGLGIVLSDLADYPQALAAFKTAIELSSDTDKKNLIIYYTGLVHLANRDYRGYQTSLEQLKTDAKYYDPLKKLGNFWKTARSEN